MNNIVRKSFIFVFIFIFSFIGNIVFAESVQDKTYSQNIPSYNEVSSFIVGDLNSKEILYGKDINTSRPVASMSKLMTYFLTKKAISDGKLSMDTKVKISNNAAALAQAMYSNFDLKAGEEVSVKLLLDGLMVVSGNDAAVALAEAVSGTEKEFVNLMNKTAKELKLSNSHFVNASGIQQENGQNSMSPYDLFILASELTKKFPEVREYAKISVLSVPERNFIHKSTIPLVGEVPGIEGLKTGYTDEAKYCFTSLVNLNLINSSFKNEIITVLMGAPKKALRASITKELIDYVPNNYSEVKVTDTKIPEKVIENYSHYKDPIELYPSKSIDLFVSKEDKITKKSYVDELKNNTVPTGKLEIFKNNEKICTVKLVGQVTLKTNGFFTRIIETFKNITNFLGIILFN